MTPDEFIEFLKKRCREKIVGEPAFFERDHGRDEAYRDILTFINLYQKEKANGENLTA
jgi:hypothetical protein